MRVSAKRPKPFLLSTGLALGVALTSAAPAYAASPLTIIASLYRIGAQSPVDGALTIGPDETIYGMGSNGTLFQLKPPQTGTRWISTVVATFPNEFSDSPVLIGPDGSLYSTTVYGGSECDGGRGCGFVFRMIPNAGNGGWTQQVLHTFNYTQLGPNADGAFGQGTLVLDKRGNLFGTTQAGGLGFGTVYKLSPEHDGKRWTETILYRFTGGSDGDTPISGLVMDKHGVLYGTTILGGTGNGNVFSMTPPQEGQSAWTETSLYAFAGGAADGVSPNGLPAIADDGKLYGTTTFGGSQSPDGPGIVYELVPPARNTGGWTENVIWKGVSPRSGYNPNGGVIIGEHHALYTTTMAGGRVNRGLIFKLSPPDKTHSMWHETVIADFQPATGIQPYIGVTADSAGNLFGATAFGAYHFGGTIFEIPAK